MNAETSPRLLSRTGGVLYLILIAGGLFGEVFVRGGAIVPGNAAATAARILARESLWRFGIALEYFMLACTVALALILYILLRRVHRDLALLAIFFNLMSIAVEATNELRLLGALLPLKSAAAVGAFDIEQLYAMSSLSIRSYSYGFGAALIFFGFECLVLGYLIFRSRFMPASIGVLMQLAGASYLVNSFALILAPELAARLFPAILIPALIGESSLCLWLLVKGVDVEKWKPAASPEPLRPAPATVQA